MLQLRWYWAGCQPEAASWVPNKLYAGDGQQKYVGYPNSVQSMLMTNMQTLFDDVILTMTKYLCMHYCNVIS